jgi:hypothetical protein
MSEPTNINSRRPDPAAQPADEAPATEFYMDEDRIVFRDKAALDQYAAEAWDAGWQAARRVVELDGKKVWAHTVYPEGHEGNPHR